VSHGFICPKGRALPEIENAPDRLRTPLRRRKTGGWDEIGWEEALDVLDGTPLLDIKPHIPRFDCFPDASEGWAKGKLPRPKPPGRE
jgi:anaerobic selenocysteine-containing dehydrogenase